MFLATTCPTTSSLGTIHHTPTNSAIALKRQGYGKDVNDPQDGIERGEIDDIHEFLEQSGNYFVPLLAQSPMQVSKISTSTKEKGTLFSETRIGRYMGQEDVPISAVEEQEMLKVVNYHQHVLNIADTQEMMVGITSNMPFELQQFDLFHVCMHMALMLLRTPTRRVVLL
jgi:uncharacterized protein YpbB